METWLFPTGSDSGEKHPSPPDYAIAVSLNNYRHTYGDAVRGLVTLKLPETVSLELLEMKFTGICGTGIKYSKSQTTMSKLEEEKHLFTHTQTLISQRQAKPGTHKFSYAFRFPKREEVVLAPSIEPVTSDNYFYFRYQVSATAVVEDSSGKIHEFSTTRTPDFMSSKDGETDVSDEYTRVAAPAESQSFVMNTVLGRRSSTSSIDDGSERVVATLSAPRVIHSKNDLIMPISLQVEKSKRSKSTRRARLTKVTLALRSRIRLTAQGVTVTMNSVNQPIQIASANLRKTSPVHSFSGNETVEMECKLPMCAPHYLRSSFVNDLIAYEYLLKVKAEFEIDGKHYISRFDHIPVVLQPAFTQPDLDGHDYAASPPELSDDLADDFFGTPPSSVPTTPPPEFSEFADEEVERRFRPCFRQDSSSSSLYASSIWEHTPTPIKPPAYGPTSKVLS